MPQRPLTPCPHPGCPALTMGGGCPAHRGRGRREARQAHDATRASATERGYDSRWRKARAGFLAKHPLCVRCEGQGKVRVATVVDHITPHRGDKALFWDRDNWEGLCAPCHNSWKQRLERAGGAPES